MRWTRGLGKDDFPLLFGIVEPAIEVDIIHQCNSDHCRQPKEAPLAF